MLKSLNNYKFITSMACIKLKSTQYNRLTNVHCFENYSLNLLKDKLKPIGS